MSDPVYNERQSLRLRATFTNADGQPVTPDAVTYRVDNADTGEPVVAETPVAEPATVVDVVITREQNALQDAAAPRERRVVTLDFSYDAGAQGAPIEYRYTLRNLRFVS
ncbi:MAG: hypothetical protein AB1578_07050 [Thermodesulfobacteriota bacterium]